MLKPEEFEMTMPEELRSEMMTHLAKSAERRAKKLRVSGFLFRLCEIVFAYSAVSSAYLSTDNHNAVSIIVLASVIGALASHAQANNYQTLAEKTKIEAEHMEKWKNLL